MNPVLLDTAQVNKLRLFTSLIWTMLAAACVSVGNGVNEKMDPTTGATVSYINIPFIFYRDRSGTAAYARNFVNLGPIRVNQMGDYRYFIWLAIWSTAQSLPDSSERDGFEVIYLFVDGEPFELELEGWTVGAIGAGEPIYGKPVSTATEGFYPVTYDQVRRIARANDLQILTTGFQPQSFEPWGDQSSAKESLARFVRYDDY